MQTATQPNQKIVIDSIGTANPSISNLLAESFQLPHELVLKLLYTAPSVLLGDVTPDLAQQTYTLLEKLGLEVTLKDKAEKLPKNKALFDISIHIDEIEKLPLIINQLCDFLGCDEKEALHLLLQVPSTVLGGVSESTAKAFSKRVDANIVVSDPKKDLYMLELTGADTTSKRRLEEFLKIKIESDFVYDIDYQMTKKIWSSFQANKNLKIVNQSHLRFELILDKSDDKVSPTDLEQILNKEIGMPREIIPEVLNNLPVQLYSSLEKSETEEKQNRYKSYGLTCTVKPVLYEEHIIELYQLEYGVEIIQLLSNFFSEKDLPVEGKHWVSPYALPTALMEYITFHFERIDCEFEVKKKA